MLRIIAGTVRGTKLFDVHKNTTRPLTSRVKTSLFDILHFDLPDAAVLDLYSGTGSMGIEALSRGAAHCTFVDSDPDCINVINKNINKTGFQDKSTILQLSVSQFLKQDNHVLFHIILYDPPFRLLDQKDKIEKEIFQISGWLQTAGNLVFHHPQKLPIELKFMELKKIKKFGINQISFYIKKKEN